MSNACIKMLEDAGWVRVTDVMDCYEGDIVTYASPYLKEVPTPGNSYYGVVSHEKFMEEFPDLYQFSKNTHVIANWGEGMNPGYIGLKEYPVYKKITAIPYDPAQQPFDEGDI
jgi:hypothetical protein